MDIRELRIGNLVQYNLKSRVFDKGTKVIPLAIIVINSNNLFNENVMLDEPFDNVYDLTQIEPIPLTEKLVNKFAHQFESDISLLFTGSTLKVFHKGVIIRILKFVHEYQNFHYALTEKELIVS